MTERVTIVCYIVIAVTITTVVFNLPKANKKENIMPKEMSAILNGKVLTGQPVGKHIVYGSPEAIEELKAELAKIPKPRKKRATTK